MTSKEVKKIENYLDTLFPEPHCELIYHSDWELLLAVVLSAQSTDKRVNSVMPLLLSEYQTLKELKNADLSKLEQILRPIGSYHKKAYYVKEIARILDEEYQGILPQERTLLEQLPGVGRKTVNVVLSELYNYPAIAVDTHVERISKRLYLAALKDGPYEVEKKLMKHFAKETWGKRHLQMVLFGRYYCKAVKPSCDNCALKTLCREQKIRKQANKNRIEIE